MEIDTALIVVTVLFVLMGCGLCRKHVAPEKIRWYDWLVLIAWCFVILGIDSWVMRLGGLGHIAYTFGLGWYAIDVIDARPMPKTSGLNCLESRGQLAHREGSSYMDAPLDASSRAFQIREAGNVSVIKLHGQLGRSDAEALNNEVARRVQSGQCGLVIDLGDCAQDPDTMINLFISFDKMLKAGAVVPCLVRGAWFNQWVQATFMGGPVFGCGADEAQAIVQVQSWLKQAKDR